MQTVMHSLSLTRSYLSSGDSTFLTGVDHQLKVSKHRRASLATPHPQFQAWLQTQRQYAMHVVDKIHRTPD